LDPVPTRLRLPELLEERGLTAYEVARRSRGRIDASALYRLVRQHGRVTRFSADLIDALCDVLGVAPGELLTRSRGRGKAVRSRRRVAGPR
jgi:DNA-binding Xre family transcriptional regulator